MYYNHEMREVPLRNILNYRLWKDADFTKKNTAEGRKQSRSDWKVWLKAEPNYAQTRSQPLACLRATAEPWPYGEMFVLCEPRLERLGQ